MSERLTIPHYRVLTADGKVTTHRSILDTKAIGLSTMELYYQLKNYEDICFDDPDKEHSTEIITLDALRDLVAAYRDGRVIPKLDCKTCGNRRNEYLCKYCYARISPENFSDNWELDENIKWQREQEAALAGEGAE